MVVEDVCHTVPTGRAEEFGRASRPAGRAPDTDSRRLGWEMARDVEEPEHVIVRIVWHSVEGHEQGFRASPAFGDLFTAVGPFFSAIEEMKHYEMLPSGDDDD